MLTLDGVSHQYGSEPALEDVSFSLDDGELVGLLGPSGCGKTTVVQAVAGHLTPTAGCVRLRGADVTTMPPEERHVGVVFQRSTLYPHMTVGENVAYGLTACETTDTDRAQTVAEYLELVGLAGRHDSHPDELSGGQRRRVELARALAPEPDVLLLDEPLSALDRPLRSQLRNAIARIQKETKVTTLFVTHDQEEAMSLAERLIILNDGAISAMGHPRRLYESPPNRFVASFLGRSNVISATVVKLDPLTLEIGETVMEITGHSQTDLCRGDDLRVHTRPADTAILAADAADTTVRLPGTVASVTDIGSRYDVRVRLSSGEEVTIEREQSPPGVDEQVTIGIAETDLSVFSGENGFRR
ncbi:MAG: ABC-type spermidine/putrescine transport system, ATPase component [uncultured archaeon A07HR60]|nr:MAG: ABC-type spermidine/putrescine transport system, ATPase component [uncultured archaeon A07HR60]